jgi:tRNA modification GTPase
MLRKLSMTAPSQLTTMPDNRAYLLTPPGPAAIAVVRLVGPAVPAFLRSHFSKQPVEQRCVHGDLIDEGQVLDDPVIVLLPGAAAADVNLHGGPWVVQSVLDLARREGFDVIQNTDPPVPLEAADGANLLEKEVSAHLPLARTELAVRVLAAQPAAWSALIDRVTPRPGEEAHLARWLGRAQSIQAELDGILEDNSLHWLLHPPRVAIVGAPNVGKSTLANRLFARELIITADLPGTTRDWVGEIANLDGLAILLVDTPGIRQTTDAIEAQAIAASGEQIKSADLVVIVLDATRPLEGEQAIVLEAHPDALRVVNKTDLPPAFDLALVHGPRTVAATGAGINDLRHEIRSRFGLTPGFDETWPRWWTSRQKAVLEESLARIDLIGRMIDG